MNRIRKLKILVVAFALCYTAVSCTRHSTDERPNIIYIYTDQQSASMMGCAGNSYVKTPAMDYIAEHGIRFTRAYTTNPVCSPARVSLMTGRFPGEFTDSEGKQVRENGSSMRITEVSEEVLNTSLPAYLKEAGYNLYFGGKTHLPPSLLPEALGFTDISRNERELLAGDVAELIRADHEKPYFLVVSLINPHDICYMAIRDFEAPDHPILIHGTTELTMLDSALQIPGGLSGDEFWSEYVPPLPPNFEAQEGEPGAIHSMLSRRNFRIRARNEYTDEQWRMHRYAYARLTEDVDSHVQTILEALKESGQEENTLVLFSSDHGDMDGSHRMEHKTTLYEESANIPFLAMWKGHIPAGQVNTTSLVSNGLDLLPTVCDYAGIQAKSDPRGESLRPLFEGKTTGWRKTLGVESEIGRMVVSDDGLKYILYDAAGVEEQLLDLASDPFETRHFTRNQEYSNKLDKMRKSYDEEWFPQTDPLDFSSYPYTELSNGEVQMKVWLPDPEKGLYRATRFDWSGVIGSVKFRDHEYFGYWKDTHDPEYHEDLTGPVEGFIKPGLGYEEALPGEGFIRIGVGILEKEEEEEYVWDKTYKILDPGSWTVKQGEDWMEFTHRVESDFGYGYEYTKTIRLTQDGFVLDHVLRNTGDKSIETDQFNHNFFMIDGEKSGTAFELEFPFVLSTDHDLKGYMEITDKHMRFIKDVEEDDYVYAELEGFGGDRKDHKVTVRNRNSGAGVTLKMDQPLYRMVFWACPTTLSPENFIWISVKPGEEASWIADYHLFVE
jgi:choline-sulfatase